MLLSNTLSRGIATAMVEVPHHIEERVLKTAVEALDFAKEQASWGDRTGDARAGLDTDVSQEGEVIVWTLFHTVEYGIWLEVRWNGKYAVIMPTLELYADRLGNNMDETLDGNYE